MEKYSKSDNTISMLSDYMDILDRYAEFTEKVDKLDEEEMTDAELAYYLEVITRIEKKMLESLDSYS